jgi:RNA polymerase sigma-70 factor (ECF subfamily)
MATDEWQVWFDHHAAALVLFARQWVLNFADAEDVVQEAFVRFWRSRQKARDPAAYLYACTRRCALDWQRSRERRARREQAVVRSEAQILFAGPQEQDDRCALISAALQNLPEDQREIVVMKFWGGLSFPQIADVLRIPANTAASRYRYALAKLREPLAKEVTP